MHKAAALRKKMTAEVAILNKLAVALAADSALTTGFPGSEKIFSGANKIFALSDVAPVGVMIYGHVEYCSIPWETIIKQFRRTLADERLPKIVDYVERFKAYLATPKFITNDQQDAYVFYCCVSAYLSAVDAIEKRGLTPDSNSFEIALTEMEEIAHAYRAIPGFGSYKLADFIVSYDHVLNAFFEEKDFIRVNIPEDRKEQFKSIVYLDILNIRATALMTGVVIAGFGEDEIFPTIKEIKVDGAVNNCVRVWDGQFCDITRGNDAVFVSAFAQDDAANAFIEGADGEYKAFWSQMLEAFLTNYTEEFLEQHTQYDEANRKVVLAMAKGKIEETIDEFRGELESFSSNVYRQPVENVLRSAPKDELAHVAEALVNLTALKRRVSGDRETVGGPIDVAVISKGDGLVWIKRKHYFPQELNLQFVRNRFGGINGWTGKAGEKG